MRHVLLSFSEELYVGYMLCVPVHNPNLTCTGTRVQVRVRVMYGGQVHTVTGTQESFCRGHIGTGTRGCWDTLVEGRTGLTTPRDIQTVSPVRPEDKVQRRAVSGRIELGTSALPEHTGRLVSGVR